MRSPRQANVRKGRIEGRELRVAIRLQRDGVVCLVVETVSERQRYGGRAVIAMIADVGGAWDDATSDLGYLVMVLRRATGYGVTSRERRAGIAELIGDRSGSNVRAQAAAEIHVQRKPRGRVSIHHADSRDTGTAVPLTVRSLVWTEAGSTGSLKFTSY